jgi:ribosome assembly protein 4
MSDAVDKADTAITQPASKKSKKSEIEIPSSVIAVFVNQDGERAGSGPLEVPASSTPKQLEMLVNALLHNDSPLPYAFYVNDVEIEDTFTATLSGLVSSGSLKSLEEIVSVSFQPLSVYRVRPVTRCAETMPGHSDAVTYVQFSPDGKQLASGGGDMTIRFWNTSALMPYHTCQGHRNHILAVCWAPDSSVLVSADKNGEIRAWDPSSGKQRGSTMTGHNKYVSSMVFEPFHANPECSRMASASKDHTIKVWNMKTCVCETTISGHSDSVEAVKWGGNGLLYTASRDRFA